ncbi:MAG: diguanylate cyclase [Gloeotrichia echinulata IR180]|jgi:diguanylate cyclase (GGDEF)-like protein/PAS domain S-box-containing protein|nr:diguanylate cyclase [Gloeotrichia echinulata DEX184]
MFAHKIMVIEDEKLLALDIRKSLQKLGCSVTEITDFGEDTIKKVAEIHPDLVLIDICVTGEINGMHLVDIIQKDFHVPVLYLTEYSEYLNLDKKQLSEPFSYILKPCAEKDLRVAIEMALYKHQIAQTYQAEKQRLTTILNSMGCGVVVTSTNGHIQMMNPIAEALTGWQQHEALGKDLAEVVRLIDKDMDEEVKNLTTRAMETGKVLNLPQNCTLIAKDGNKIPIGDSVAPIRDNHGNMTGAVLVFQDITQRKEIEAKLLRNACYDGLTKLPNRVLFLDRLRQAIERSKRRIDYRFAVLFLDLDGFKGINDRFGHGVGDDFLVEIAQRLESSLRSGDTVARFGGDEFAVLLEDIKDVTDATNVAKRIQENLGLPLILNEHQIFPTASIGIALSGRDSEEPQNLLRDADIAMYRAKRQGKARYGIFY